MPSSWLCSRISVQPFGFATGDRRRLGNASRRGQFQAREAPAQVFGSAVPACPGLGKLGLGLSQGSFRLDGIEAGGITELLATPDRCGLLFEQRELVCPLFRAGAFLQPDEPIPEQRAARFVQRVALRRFGDGDADCPEFGIG